jgi:hypothetical protein
VGEEGVPSLPEDLVNLPLFTGENGLNIKKMAAARFDVLRTIA